MAQVAEHDRPERVGVLAPRESARVGQQAPSGGMDHQFRQLGGRRIVRVDVHHQHGLEEPLQPRQEQRVGAFAVRCDEDQAVDAVVMACEVGSSDLRAGAVGEHGDPLDAEVGAQGLDILGGPHIGHDQRAVGDQASEITEFGRIDARAAETQQQRGRRPARDTPAGQASGSSTSHRSNASSTCATAGSTVSGSNSTSILCIVAPVCRP